jgi:hypothetical protein
LGDERRIHTLFAGHAEVLEQTLEEEKETDVKLTSPSERVNPTAAGTTDRNKVVKGSAEGRVLSRGANQGDLDDWTSKQASFEVQIQ